MLTQTALLGVASPTRTIQLMKEDTLLKHNVSMSCVNSEPLAQLQCQYLSVQHV